MEDKRRLSEFTTFCIGGPADVLEITGDDDLAQYYTGKETVLGGGSNVLASDQGVSGKVLLNRRRGVERFGSTLYVRSGEPLPALSRRALSEGLSGLEWAEGIPGTVGGAVRMNAGAFGGCAADTLLYADVFDGKRFYRIAAADCGFDYRTSRFVREPVFIAGAAFLLSERDSSEIADVMRGFRAQRREKQPAGRSAGSVYKAAAMPAGYYIDRAGLKGRTIGGAAVSEKHANFILNLGGATAADVRALMSEIESAVTAQFGVTLRPEICLIGDF